MAPDDDSGENDPEGDRRDDSGREEGMPEEPGGAEGGSTDLDAPADWLEEDPAREDPLDDWIPPDTTSTDGDSHGEDTREDPGAGTGSDEGESVHGGGSEPAETGESESSDGGDREGTTGDDRQGYRAKHPTVPSEDPDPASRYGGRPGGQDPGTAGDGEPAREDPGEPARDGPRDPGGTGSSTGHDEGSSSPDPDEDRSPRETERTTSSGATGAAPSASASDTAEGRPRGDDPSGDHPSREDPTEKRSPDDSGAGVAGDAATGSGETDATGEVGSTAGGAEERPAEPGGVLDRITSTLGIEHTHGPLATGLVVAISALLGLYAAWLFADLVWRPLSVLVVGIVAASATYVRPTVRGIVVRGLFGLSVLLVATPVWLSLSLLAVPYGTAGIGDPLPLLLTVGDVVYLAVFGALAAIPAGIGIFLEWRR